MGDDSLDLAALLTSWQVALRGERKSPNTLRIYRTAVASFLAFCAERNTPSELTKENVVAFLASAADNESSTVRLRLTVLKLFAKWLAAEEGFDDLPIRAIKPPKLDQRSVPDLSENEVRALIDACNGTSLRDRRDKAIVTMLAETGLRAAELLALDIGDVDIIACTAQVLGKGGKGRRVKFSTGCATILDRYIRARRNAVHHPTQGPLWITNRGRMSYTGLVSTLTARADTAGVKGFHIHRLRHTAAVRWLRSGGSEVGLMAQAGWASNQMIGRYVKTASEQLAAEEFDRLGLGLGEH